LLLQPRRKRNVVGVHARSVPTARAGDRS
jgi:hypothetical protein